MERLITLALGLFAALVAVRLDLTYIGFAVLVGIALPLVSLRGTDMFDSARPGVVCAIIGLLVLLLACFVCMQYGIGFEALDQDRSFPKLVRRLPFFGFAFLSSGLTAIAISILRKT